MDTKKSLKVVGYFSYIKNKRANKNEDEISVKKTDSKIIASEVKGIRNDVTTRKYLGVPEIKQNQWFTFVFKFMCICAIFWS